MSRSYQLISSFIKLWFLFKNLHSTLAPLSVMPCFWSFSSFKHLLTSSMWARWWVVSSCWLWSSGFERLMLRRVWLARRTVANAMTQSVVRSVSAKLRTVMISFTCNMDAICIPPSCPILLPSNSKTSIELFNLKQLKKVV